jgi:hypothetical protein
MARTQGWLPTNSWQEMEVFCSTACKGLNPANNMGAWGWIFLWLSLQERPQHQLIPWLQGKTLILRIH